MRFLPNLIYRNNGCCRGRFYATINSEYRINPPKDIQKVWTYYGHQVFLIYSHPYLRGALIICPKCSESILQETIHTEIEKHPDYKDSLEYMIDDGHNKRVESRCRIKINKTDCKIYGVQSEDLLEFRGAFRWYEVIIKRHNLK